MSEIRTRSLSHLYFARSFKKHVDRKTGATGRCVQNGPTVNELRFRRSLKNGSDGY